MPDTSASTAPTRATTAIIPIESPPASAQPLNPSTTEDPLGRLHRLAIQLVRTQNRRLLAEFLILRRATR